MQNIKKDWEIHFIPLCHHDYGYTRPAEPLLSDYMQYYRDVLRLIEQTDGYPEAAKYHYTCEQVWSVWHFLGHCTAEEKERFIHHARAGRIEVSAFWGNTAEAHCSNEEIIRMMYPAFELKRRYGIPIYGGSSVDMTGQGWGLPKVAAGAGLEYFFNGMPSYFSWVDICGVHGVGAVHGYWDPDRVLRHGMPDAYWWEGQDGGRIFTYYQGSYGWFRGWLADGMTPGECEAPESLEDVEAHLPAILEGMEARGVPFNVLRYIDHGGDNCPPQKTICDIVKAWNEKYDTPKLRVSTNAEFFRRLRQSGVEFPVYRDEIPHTEFTSATLSFAKETGLNFRNHAAAATAEFLTAAAKLEGLGAPEQAALSAVYNDILMFDEHCYGMADPFGPAYDFNWSTKAHHAYRAADGAANIARAAGGALAAGVAVEGPHITVFNPLSFERDDVVELAGLPLQNYDLIDCGSGALVPHAVCHVDRYDLTDELSAERETLFRMGEPERRQASKLVFTAGGVPAMGWKTYRLEPKPAPGAAAGKGAGNTLENEFYRIDFDAESGRLLRLFDKQAGRELADAASPHPFAGVVCRDCETQKEYLPEYLGFELVHSDGVMQKALVKFRVKGAPEAALGLTLYAGIKRVDFELKLLLDGLPVHEWFLALPLDIDAPHFEYEGAQCRPTPFRDQFPGSNTNYHCAQSWASSGNGELKAAVSSAEAHSMSFGGLWPSYVSQAHHAVHPVDYGRPYATRADITKGSMYLLLAYNNIRTNFRMTQSGWVRYTFSLATGAPELSPTRFGWSVQSRLSAAYSEQEGALAPEACLVQTDAENVQVLTLKQAEDGDGLVLRLMETEGRPAKVRVTLPGRDISQLFAASLVEEKGEALPFEGGGFIVRMGPFETRTVRVVL